MITATYSKKDPNFLIRLFGRLLNHQMYKLNHILTLMLKFLMLSAHFFTSNQMYSAYYLIFCLEIRYMVLVVPSLVTRFYLWIFFHATNTCVPMYSSLCKLDALSLIYVIIRDRLCMYIICTNVHMRVIARSLKNQFFLEKC